MLEFTILEVGNAEATLELLLAILNKNRHVAAELFKWMKRSYPDLIVGVENVLDDFGSPFYAAALAEGFQSKKAIAIKRGADNQDIIGIDNLPGAPNCGVNFQIDRAAR